MGTGPSVNRVISTVELSATWMKPWVPANMKMPMKFVVMEGEGHGDPDGHQTDDHAY